MQARFCHMPLLSPSVSLHPLSGKVQTSQQDSSLPCYHFCSDLSQLSSPFSPHPLTPSSFPSPALVLQHYVHFSKQHQSFLQSFCTSCSSWLTLALPCLTKQATQLLLFKTLPFFLLFKTLFLITSSQWPPLTSAGLLGAPLPFALALNYQGPYHNVSHANYLFSFCHHLTSHWTISSLSQGRCLIGFFLSFSFFGMLSVWHCVWH